MADARQEFTTALLEARDGSGIATFRASGKRVLFAGYFRAYVEGSDDPEAALDDQDDPLPDLRDGQPLECLDTEAQGHETKPPARYTEASLIRTLEREGIGRPSTYATIMDTIVERGYVWRKSNQLVPTFTAFATNALLEQQFDRLVDVGFTAGMEQILDDIASGRTKARPYLEEFYAGATGLEASVADGLDTIDARQVSCIGIPAWEPYVVRVGRYGPYVEAQVNGDRIAASLPDGVAPADIDRELLEELVDSSSRRGVKLDDHPESGLPIYVRRGPYGHYVQMGEDDDDGKPRRVSLPPGVEPDQVDVKTAAALLALPRTLGTHPESGEPILANIGRYGPYVQHRRTFASLGASEDVLAIGLERALELIAAKEVRNKPIKSLGPHPETGAPVDVLKGRYGPYVKHQRTNASLPKGSDPEALTLEEAVDLLSKKAASGGRKGRRSRAKKK
jgi:DNA topoisomerase-1